VGLAHLAWLEGEEEGKEQEVEAYTTQHHPFLLFCFE
jgi:hypothetical protein